MTTKLETNGDWLTDWRPEDDEFWESGGKQVAHRTLGITTAALTVSTAVWFVVSALIARLPKSGFDFTTEQLYWLVAMPGLAGGTLRIVHMFLTPIIGTRKVVAFSTATLLLPLIGWYIAIQDTSTDYWVFMGLAFLAGLGAGNFSSFMPSTTLFFPKKRLGTALATQAGISNYGVTLVQFLAPLIIGFAVIGSSQTFHKKPESPGKEIFLQNIVLLWIPLVVVIALLAWWKLRSVPVKANMKEQLDIFNTHHTCAMTSFYLMTFGAFSGLAAALPLLIEKRFGDFSGAPDPLAWAFIGPLIGSTTRIVSGPLSDRFGGARLTQISAVGMALSSLAVNFFIRPKSMDEFAPFLIAMCGIFFFAGIGNASVFKQAAGLFDARRAAGVVGWIAAVAAYGPFIVSVLIANAVALDGSPGPFFCAFTAFCTFNVILNWWFYARRNAPNKC